MGMKKSLFLLLFLLVLVISCGTGPQPAVTAVAPVETEQQTSTTGPETPIVVPETPVEKVFDPGSISDEVFAATKADIQVLIADLNRIIRSRNFNAWLGYLSDSYRHLISSPEFLAEKTEELYRRDQVVATNMGRDPKMVEKRLLRTPSDYFNYVVVPSRSNDRLDDIAFVSETEVKAYTVDTRGQRLILYDLYLIDGKWKIIS